MCEFIITPRKALRGYGAHPTSKDPRGIVGRLRSPDQYFPFFACFSAFLSFLDLVGCFLVSFLVSFDFAMAVFVIVCGSILIKALRYCQVHLTNSLNSSQRLVL
jgi:hypothetical protein